MPKYEIERGGKRYEVEAKSPDAAMAALDYHLSRQTEAQSRDTQMGTNVRAGLRAAADAPRRVAEAFQQLGSAVGEKVGLLPEGSTALQTEDALARRTAVTGGDPGAEQAADIAETGLLLVPGVSVARGAGALPRLQEATTAVGAIGRGARQGAVAGALAQPLNEEAVTPEDVLSGRAAGGAAGAGLGGAVGLVGGALPATRNFFARQIQNLRKDEETVARLKSARAFMGEDNPYPFSVSQQTGSAVMRQIELQVQATAAQNYFNRQYERFAEKAQALAAGFARAGRSPSPSAYGIALGVSKAWNTQARTQQQAASRLYGQRTATAINLAAQDPSKFPIPFSNLQGVNARWAQETGQPWWRIVNPGANRNVPEFQTLDRYLSDLNQRNARIQAVGQETGEQFPLEGLSVAEVIRIRRALNTQDQKYYEALKTGDPSAVDKNAHRALREMIDAVDADIDQFIAAAPPGSKAVEALKEYRSANVDYKAFRQLRDDMSQTAVGQLFGFRIPDDPEAAVRKIAGMEPEQQRYMVQAIKEADPELLLDLKTWIVQDATRFMVSNVGPARVGSVDPDAFAKALTNRYGNMIGSEIFSAAEKAKLTRGLDTVRVLTNASKDRVSPALAPQIEGGGMALATMSEAFITRQVIRIAGNGKLENVLFSPEGLRSLEVLRNTYRKPTEETARALSKLMSIAMVPEVQ